MNRRLTGWMVGVLACLGGGIGFLVLAQRAMDAANGSTLLATWFGGPYILMGCIGGAIAGALLGLMLGMVFNKMRK